MTLRLYFTAFISGLVSLALELAASRLLEPFFGTSNLVWVAIIGLILLFLAVGYAVGGRWADRSPYPATLYGILIAAGAAIAVIPLIARPVLLLAAKGFMAWNAVQVAGTFGAVLILFTLPVTLLACVSPFVIRLAMVADGKTNEATSTGVARVGITAGRVYAVSTAGSFLGTFLPTLWLIPALGTRRTFLTLALLTVGVGLMGLWWAARRWFWRLVWIVLVIAALFGLQPDVIKPQAGLIYETESAYNFIQVAEGEHGVRYLLLNEGQGVHSMYTPGGQVLTGGTWDFFLIAPYFNPSPYLPGDVDNLLVIGLAAGTTPYQYTQLYGPIPIDGVEIDPEIVEVGRTYFAMTQPHLDVHVMDGRTYLWRTKKRYDVIAVDAYRLPYIPWHLTTVEFFRQVRQHLTPEGVVAINVGHTPDDWRLVEIMVATMGEVFPSVHTIDVPETFNAILVGTVQRTTVDDFAANLALLKDKRLHAVGVSALHNLRDITHSARVFTDDRAPVEQLTNALALRYILQMQ
jgi:spermidine synthase